MFEISWWLKTTNHRRRKGREGTGKKGKEWKQRENKGREDKEKEGKRREEDLLNVSNITTSVTIKFSGLA